MRQSAKPQSVTLIDFSHGFLTGDSRNSDLICTSNMGSGVCPAEIGAHQLVTNSQDDVTCVFVALLPRIVTETPWDFVVILDCLPSTRGRNSARAPTQKCSSRQEKITLRQKRTLGPLSLHSHRYNSGRAQPSRP